MANVKITELGALASAASGDLVPVVDVTDDTTKKATAGQIVSVISQVELPLGSATTPTVRFDPNTGIYSPGADEVAISTNSSERIRIGANGEIGIGGANYGTSGQVLTSAGSGVAPSWQTPAAGNDDKIEEGNSSVEVIDTGSDGRVVFTTEGTEALRITNDRYVRLASGSLGIQFNGDTAAANALDDYEEGTWTPGQGNFATWTSPTFNASYTKIGRLVQVNLHQTGGTIGWAATQYMAGLPYAPAAPSSAYATDTTPSSDNGPLLLWTSSIIYFQAANASENGLVFSATYYTT